MPTCQLHPLGRDNLVAPGVHIALTRQHHCVAFGRRHSIDDLALQAYGQTILSLAQRSVPRRVTAES